MPARGGPIKRVRQQTGVPTLGNVATPVYGYLTPPPGVSVEGGPALPVRVITDADLIQNGGTFTVSGEYQYLPVMDAEDGAIVEGGSVLPIYLAEGALGSEQTYSEKLISLFGASLIGYWPMNEPSGVVSYDRSPQANNGAYTNVTLGQPGIGDGNTAASYNGTTSFDNIYSAGLNSDFLPASGGLFGWFRVSAAGVWTDAAARSIARIGADSNNRIIFEKSSTNNRMTLSYVAGAVAKATAIDGLTSADWLFAGLSWDTGTDEVKAYLGNTQQGATLTGLGTWAGALSATACVLGARSPTPSDPWSGFLAHVLLTSRPPTPGEIVQMYTL